GGIAVSILHTEANDQGGVSASFGARLEHAKGLTVQTNANDTTGAKIHVANVGVLFSGAFADSNASVGGADSSSIGGGATIESPGTAITVEATRVSEAEASASGGDAGFINRNALKSAATVNGSTKAYADGGAVIGNNTGTPANLSISATDTSAANVDTSIGSGGAFDASDVESDATVTPEVDAYIGPNSHVKLSGDLNITATNIHSEAHTLGTAYGGGAVLIGGAGSTTTSSPSVSAYLDTGTTLSANNVTLDAEARSDPTGTPLVDYFNPSTDAHDFNDTIHFDRHSLTTGDTVLYTVSGTNGVGSVIPGLNDGALYNVIVVGSGNDTLQFGNLFHTGSVDAGQIPGSNEGVDSNRSMIRFPFAHNFHNGDPVILSDVPAANGQTPPPYGSIGPVKDSTTYYARVIDPFTIELYTSQSDATQSPTTFHPANVSGNDIQVSNSFSNSGNYRVTYESAPPLPFQKDGVDIDPGDYSNHNNSFKDIVLGPVYDT